MSVLSGSPLAPAGPGGPKLPCGPRFPGGPGGPLSDSLDWDAQVRTTWFAPHVKFIARGKTSVIMNSDWNILLNEQSKLKMFYKY